MSQSLVSNYVHIIFSTKNRDNLILSEIENELYSYITGICNKLDCTLVQIGGTSDHIHILCSLSKKISLIDLLEKIKSNSSKWIKTKGNKYSKFYWQNGYGAFSVSPNMVDKVKVYIVDQKEHHRVKSFKEEYVLFLKKYNINFDEKYVWD